MYFLQQISSFNNLKNNINYKVDKIIDQIEHKYCDDYNQELYCIYIGKTNSSYGLKNRIIASHIKGNAEGSTFRKSIYSLKYGGFDYYNQQHRIQEKEYVNEIIDDLFIEWQDYPQEELDNIEIREINSFLRIFNIDSTDENIYPFDNTLRRLILNSLSAARRK